MGTDFFLHGGPPLILYGRRLHGRAVHVWIDGGRHGRSGHGLHVGGAVAVRDGALQRRVVGEGGGHGRAVWVVVGALWRTGVLVGVRVATLLEQC